MSLWIGITLDPAFKDFHGFDPDETREIAEMSFGSVAEVCIREG